MPITHIICSWVSKGVQSPYLFIYCRLISFPLIYSVSRITCPLDLISFSITYEFSLLNCNYAQLQQSKLHYFILVDVYVSFFIITSIYSLTRLDHFTQIFPFVPLFKYLLTDMLIFVQKCINAYTQLYMYRDSYLSFSWKKRLTRQIQWVLNIPPYETVKLWNEIIFTWSNIIGGIVSTNFVEQLSAVSVVCM